MVTRRVFDNERHIHFLTFSRHKRRTFLQQDQSNRIVIGQLGSRLAKHDGICTRFVILPDRMHALTWFPGPVWCHAHVAKQRGHAD